MHNRVQRARREGKHVPAVHRDPGVLPRVYEREASLRVRRHELHDQIAQRRVETCARGRKGAGVTAELAASGGGAPE